MLHKAARVAARRAGRLAAKYAAFKANTRQSYSIGMHGPEDCNVNNNACPKMDVNGSQTKSMSFEMVESGGVGSHAELAM